jgi:hypothetical protein
MLNRCFLANLFDEQTFMFLNRNLEPTMDERRTLKILAWTVGSVVGMMFILNGIALSFVQSGSPLAVKQVAAAHAPRSSAPQFHVDAGARGG